MRILFIAEPFYQYAEYIKDAIENVYSCTVDFLELFNHDIVNFSSTGRLLCRMGEKLTNGRYSEKRNFQIQEDFFNLHEKYSYDYMFCLVSKGLHIKAFETFIQKQDHAKKILYLWDDVRRVDDFKEMRGCFDVIKSFDRKDCITYGFSFLPLFYISDYEYDNEEKIYDFSIFGTLHSDREEVLKRIEALFPKNRYVWNARLVTERQVILKQFLSGKRKSLPFFIGYHTVSGKESADVLKRSRICIDIPTPGQAGLTIRTAEALAAHAKLITTNEDVKYYDFYSEENICIIDRKNPKIEVDFVEKRYIDAGRSVIELYSLKNWVRRIFE